MEVGIIGIVIALVSGLGSFVLGRWLSNARRKKKAERERAVAEAGQSRQVRRARQRQQKR
jgi:type II secretory pathway pseudopilin PulG